MGEPTRLRFILSISDSIILANPKSAILATPSFKRMFEGLMSRWITFSWCRIWNPLMTCLKKMTASNSDNRLSYFLFRYSAKSPSLQNSKIIYKLEEVFVTWINFTILGWSIFVRIAISLLICYCNCSLFCTTCMGIVLIATCLVWSSL